MILYLETKILLAQFLITIILCLIAWYLKGKKAWIPAISLLTLETIFQLYYLKALDSLYLSNAFLWAPAILNAFIFSFFYQNKQVLDNLLYTNSQKLKLSEVEITDLKKQLDSLENKQKVLESFGTFSESFKDLLNTNFIKCNLKAKEPNYLAICETLCQLTKAKNCYLYLLDKDTLKLKGYFKDKPNLDTLDPNLDFIQKLIYQKEAILNIETNPIIDFIVGKALTKADNSLFGLLLIDKLAFFELNEKTIENLNLIFSLLEANLAPKLA